MGRKPEFDCSGFQVAEFHVPPFQVFPHQLALVRWPVAFAPWQKPGNQKLSQFLRILSGLAPHPAVRMRAEAGLTLPLSSVVFPERRFPRKGSFLAWVKRELADTPEQVDRVLHGLPDELSTRPMEVTEAGPFSVVSLRLQLARTGIAIFTTAGLDPVHVEMARDSVTVVNRGQVEGCGIEILPEGMKLDDSDCPGSVRIVVTR
jgi:hypothetical protein